MLSLLNSWLNQVLFDLIVIRDEDRVEAWVDRLSKHFVLVVIEGGLEIFVLQNLQKLGLPSLVLRHVSCVFLNRHLSDFDDSTVHVLLDIVESANVDVVSLAPFFVALIFNVILANVFVTFEQLSLVFNPRLDFPIQRHL